MIGAMDPLFVPWLVTIGAAVVLGGTFLQALNEATEYRDAAAPLFKALGQLETEERKRLLKAYPVWNIEGRRRARKLARKLPLTTLQQHELRYVQMSDRKGTAWAMLFTGVAAAFAAAVMSLAQAYAAQRG